MVRFKVKARASAYFTKLGFTFVETWDAVHYNNWVFTTTPSENSDSARLFTQIAIQSFVRRIGFASEWIVTNAQTTSQLVK